MSNYQPSETRPDSESAVIFIHRLHVVRLFRSESDLRDTYFGDAVAVRRDTFLEFRDLAKKFSVKTMVRLVDELTTLPPHPTFTARDRACERPEFDPEVPLAAARALWHVLHQVGDRVKRVPSANTQPQDDYDFAVGLMTQDLVASFPKQARVLLDAVMREAAGSDRLKIPEDRLMKLVQGLAKDGKLKTKQDPWRIMQFYCSSMFEAGVLKYPGRRKREEEGDEADEPTAGREVESVE